MISDFDANTFDPDAFMNETSEEIGSTEYAQLPPGEYPAVVKKVDKPRVVDTKNGPSVVMDVTFSVSGQPINAELDRDELTVRQAYWLDMKGSSLDFGKGKNVPLFRLRQALGQNVAGPWNPMKMEGAGPVLIEIVHKPDRDGTDRAQIKKIGTL